MTSTNSLATNCDSDKRETDTKQASITRRDVVLGVGVAAGLFALGGCGFLTRINDQIVCPPGARTSADFYAMCIRCDRCREVCPTAVIGVVRIEESLVQLRTPTMEFRKGYCDTCDGTYRCIEACPTGALGAFDPAVDKIGMAVIDIDKCETYGISSSCGRVCIDACPAAALLTDDEGRVYVNEDACWGCGACEYVCPANAYRTYDGLPSRGVNIVSIEQWKRGADNDL